MTIKYVAENENSQIVNEFEAGDIYHACELFSDTFDTDPDFQVVCEGLEHESAYNGEYEIKRSHQGYEV